KDFQAPELILIAVRIGQVEVNAHMGLQTRPERAVQGKGDFTRTFFYGNTSIYVDNLNSVRKIEDLVGQDVTARFPADKFRNAAKGKLTYFIELYIRGRRIVLETDEWGR